VIVGGGFAGAWCARRLAHRGGKAVEVILLDRRNHLLFYPLLVEAGTGSLEPRHTVVPLRSLIGRARFVMAEVLGADPGGRTLRYRVAGEEESRCMEFDHLVVCPGSVTHLPPVEGLEEHAFLLKTLQDAVTLRDRAIELLERAAATEDSARRRRLLHWVVVGGSFTGVEVAGEFLELLQRGARRYPELDEAEVRVTLVEMADRLLPALDAGLARYAAEQLRNRGIELRLDESAAAIGPDRVRLNGGDVLFTETVVWTAGIGPSPLVAEMGLPTDEGGWIRCREDLRVEGLDHVWGLGDAAVNPDPSGRPYPPTAQHAVRQGVHAARNILAVIRGSTPTPFDYRALGTLVPLGYHTAVAELRGLRFGGFAAWFLWRTVYLWKMPTWRRRIRIALDWTVDLVAGHDLVQLGLARRSGGPEGDPGTGDPAGRA
jgi:NADH dehydrogenase